MDLKELKKLVALMNESGLSEVEMTLGGEKVVLKKPCAAPPQFAFAHPGFAPAPAPMAIAPAPLGAGSRGGSAGSPAQNDGVVTFNSPMVGTFYSASNPEAPAFAKVGDKIGPETVLCLIEAMKVFNEIKAETSGTIVEVLVENQEAVEFNQPLYLIKP